jgi:exonuclease III
MMCLYSEKTSGRKMRIKILTLNVDMFNLQIDDSFEAFIESYDPDIAVVQEYRANCFRHSEMLALGPAS